MAGIHYCCTSVNVQDPGQPTKPSGPIDTPQQPGGAATNPQRVKAVSNPPPQDQKKQPRNVAKVSANIFVENLPPPKVVFKPLEADERLDSTPQLVCCLGLLQASQSPDDILDPVARKWWRAVEKDVEERERLHGMATEIIRAFKQNDIKDAKAVAEVVCLAPVLGGGPFRILLQEFFSGIDHSKLLNFYHLEGLAQVIQGADPGHLQSDDLIKILELLSDRLLNTHEDSTDHMHQLTLAVSNVLDAMAETSVTGLDREKLHEPLSAYLKGFQGSKDPFMVYQAAYAHQALLCVPDNETTWQAAMRRTGKVVQGVAGLVSAVKGLDLDQFLEGLGSIQQGLSGMAEIVNVAKTAYEGVVSLKESGQDLMASLKEGFSLDQKRAWYSALRGIDTLIRDGELATFRELICEASCRREAAFQWGVCQRLGVIAANPSWDATTRRSAIALLGEIYRNDETWGQQASVKQWILNILMQLASSSGTGSQCMSRFWIIGNRQCVHIIATGLLTEQRHVMVNPYSTCHCR